MQIVGLWTSQNQKSPVVSTNKFISSVPLPHIPVAGHLSFFVHEWQNLTSDPEILDMVMGMHVELDSVPVQNKTPYPLHFSPEETAAVDEHIEILLKKGVIQH